MKKDRTSRTDSSRAIAAGLATVLADTFRLYQKTHAFHWNVEGPDFSEFHALFETQYNELWLAVDILAERVRALGHYVPASTRDFAALSSIREEEGVPEAKAMIRQLAEGHETVIGAIRKAYPVADQADDRATMALYDERLQVHEKSVWMLRSHLTRGTGDMVEADPLKKLTGKKT